MGKCVNRLVFRMLGLIFILLSAAFLLLPYHSSAQIGCPEFKLSIDETGRRVEVVLEKGSASYQISDFKIVQKNDKVEGPLDFEYSVEKVGTSIVFYGLRPSDELVLKEYAIKFYSKNCYNGQVIEIGRFKIK